MLFTSSFVSLIRVVCYCTKMEKLCYHVDDTLACIPNESRHLVSYCLCTFWAQSVCDVSCILDYYLSILPVGRCPTSHRKTGKLWSAQVKRQYWIINIGLVLKSSKVTGAASVWVRRSQMCQWPAVHTSSTGAVTTFLPVCGLKHASPRLRCFQLTWWFFQFLSQSQLSLSFSWETAV